MTHQPEYIIAKAISEMRPADRRNIHILDYALAAVIRRELNSGGWSIVPTKLAKAEKARATSNGDEK